MAKDLMFQDEVKEVVRGAYAAISTGGGRTVAGRIYTDDELAELIGRANAAQAAWRGLDRSRGRTGTRGRGAPTRPGLHHGRAIGLDIVPAMSKRARTHAAEAGVDEWTEFQLGDMERIPLPDESVDVVISNGVLNLAARKSRALAEILRVLRPGGRISLADLTVEEELPPEIANDESAWAG